MATWDAINGSERRLWRFMRSIDNSPHTWWQYNHGVSLGRAGKPIQAAFITVSRPNAAQRHNNPLIRWNYHIYHNGQIVIRASYAGTLHETMSLALWTAREYRPFTAVW